MDRKWTLIYSEISGQNVSGTRFLSYLGAHHVTGVVEWSTLSGGGRNHSFYWESQIRFWEGGWVLRARFSVIGKKNEKKKKGLRRVNARRGQCALQGSKSSLTPNSLSQVGNVLGQTVSLRLTPVYISKDIMSWRNCNLHLTYTKDVERNNQCLTRMFHWKKKPENKSQKF